MARKNKRLIMIIDDNSIQGIDEVTLLQNALEDEIKAHHLGGELDVLGYQVHHATEMDQAKLDSLIETIKNNIKQYERVILLIDLVLMRREFNSLEELEQYMGTGILLKQRIYQQLNEPEKEKICSIFISRFLNKSDDVREKLDVAIKKESAFCIEKPKQNEAESGYEKSYKKPRDEEKKDCAPMHKWFKKIQPFYEEGTLYGDFIGAVFEIALS